MVVRQTAGQKRLDALDKEHERLLREIGKKRGALATTRTLAQDLMGELSSRVEPIKQEFQSTNRELHALFARLLGPKSRLNRRDQARVRRVYAELLMELHIESNYGAGTEGNHEAHWHPCSEEPAAEPVGSGGYTDEGQSFREHPSAKDAHSPLGHRDENGTLLRSLFRRLAIALHPDRVQCEAEKAERTAIMKQVTVAYQSGDVARLVELERSLLATNPSGDAPDTLERRTSRRLTENHELRQQLRELTRELKAIKQALPFRIDLRSRNLTRDRAQRELDDAVEALESELGELRALHELITRFMDGSASLSELLSGPLLQQAIDSEEEVILAAMIAFEAREAAAPAPSSRGRQAGKNRGRAARGRQRK